MFDLGIQELIVIFVVALLVFGPKRLPELARTMGKGVAELKKAMFDIRREIDDEVGGIPDLNLSNLASGGTDDLKKVLKDKALEAAGITNTSVQDNLGAKFVKSSEEPEEADKEEGKEASPDEAQEAPKLAGDDLSDGRPDPYGGESVIPDEDDDPSANGDIDDDTDVTADADADVDGDSNA